jgi:hypothetical protein
MSKKIDYQNEPSHLREEILKRGHITPWELFKIVSWKSAKGVAWLSLNSEAEIVKFTREAVEDLTAWSWPYGALIEGNMNYEAWTLWEEKVGQVIGADQKRSESGCATGLLRLHGVGYPVATAILAFLKPEVFPVMDKWAVETIFGDGASRKRWQHKAKYREYAQLLVNPQIEDLQEVATLRGRDQKAMQLAMEKNKGSHQNAGIPIA